MEACAAHRCVAAGFGRGLAEDVSALAPRPVAARGEALLARAIENEGEVPVLHAPRRTGFHAKWLDGRIDDPGAGSNGTTL